MKTIEKVCKGVVREPGFAKNVLIGTALGIIPIINFLSFGYLLRIGQQRDEKNPFYLPDWQLSKDSIKNNLPNMLLEGTIGFLEFFLTAGLAMLICSSIFGFIDKEKFGLCLGLFVGAPIFAYVTIVCTPATKDGYACLVQKASEVYKLIAANWKKLVVPSLLFLCFQIVAFLIIPAIFMGAPLFLGFVFLIHYVKQISQ